MRQLGGEWLDAVFPVRCAVCGRDTAQQFGEHGVGDACAEHRIVAAGAYARCVACDARLPRAVPDGEACLACRRGARFPGPVVSLGDYGDPVLREWILALKHGGRFDLARPLGERLALEVRRRGVLPTGRTVVVPVPLHPLRRIERGYDQARCLAETLAAALDLPLWPRLRRRRPTPPQGSPGVGSRSANTRGALAWRSVPAFRSGSERGVRAIVVDDVLTSGATVREAARALRSSGLRPAAVAVVARAATRP